MQSKRSESNPTTTSRVLNRHNLWWLMVILLCLCLLASLQGCRTAPPCPVCPDSRITLQVEQPPTLREVQAVKRGDEYCLHDRGRKDVLIDLELLRAWGAANQAIIEEFNKRGAK